MPLQIAAFLEQLAQSRKDLSKGSSLQLHSQKRRDSLRELVEHYFNTVRPCFIGASEQDPDVGSVDTVMQELLVLCHKHGSIKRYQAMLLKARKGLIAIDARLVSSPPITAIPTHPNHIDEMIIETLNQIAPSAALSYKQALDDLGADRRLSWRGPATDLRESLRETLDHLAPDADVLMMPGYKQSTETNGPTMKQKVRFIMKSRGVARALSDPAEAATESIDSIVGTFVRSVYTRTSISTHTPTEKTEVLRIRDFVRIVLCELLEIST